VGNFPILDECQPFGVLGQQTSFSSSSYPHHHRLVFNSPMVDGVVMPLQLAGEDAAE